MTRLNRRKEGGILSLVLAEFADPIVAVGLIVFAISLAPSVYKRAGRSIPLTTSVPTVTTQAVIAITLLELGLVGTFLTGMALSGLWGALIAQRVMSRAENTAMRSSRR